jgi:hypothetical protein
MPKTFSVFTNTAIDSPNVRPIRVAHIEFDTMTFYLCDRSFGAAGSRNKLGGTAYNPVILSWGDINLQYVDVLGKNTTQATEATFTVENTRVLYGCPNFFSIACTEYINATVYLYEFYEGATSVDDLIPRFKGKIENPELDGTTVVVHCVGIENSILNKFVPEICDLSNYATADPDDIGKIFPIAFGRPKKVPFLAIDAGTLDNLSEAITNSATTITVSDILGFEVAGGVIQIDQEQILYTAISGNAFMGCTRGYNSTSAEAHNQGAVVAEVQTAYIYAIAHPIKSFDGVYVQHRKTGEQVLQSASLYTTYTGQPGNEHVDYPGKAVIVFNALPTITEQINLSIEDTIDVTDSIGVPDPSHDHAGEPAYATWFFDFASANGYIFPDDTGGTDYTGSYVSRAADGALGQFMGMGGQGLTVTVQRASVQNLEGIPSQVRVCMAIGFMDGSCGIDFTFMGRKVSYYASTGGEKNTIVKTSWLNLQEYEKDWDYINARTGTAVRTGTNPGGYVFVSELWAEFIVDKVGGTVSADYTGVTKTGTAFKTGTVNLVGNSTADTVIGGRVSADLQGWMADSSGYYGLSGSVIEQPDYVMKKFLVYYCGMSPTIDFGSSYTQVNSDYNTAGVRISPIILERENVVDFLTRIALESRSIQFFEENQHQIYFLPNYSTLTAKTFSDSRIIMDQLKLRLGARSELINSLSVSYGRFWVETYDKSSEEATKGSASGTYQSSIDTYGELTQDKIELQYINGEMQALLFLGWYIGERCWPTLEVEFQCGVYGASVRKGEIVNFEFTPDSLMFKLVSGLFQSIVTKFRIVDISVHENSTMTIVARKCTSPVGIGRTTQGVFTIGTAQSGGYYIDDGVREY